MPQDGLLTGFPEAFIRRYLFNVLSASIIVLSCFNYLVCFTIQLLEASTVSLTNFCIMCLS